MLDMTYKKAARTWVMGLGILLLVTMPLWIVFVTRYVENRFFKPAACWEAPYEALQAQKRDDIIADGHWFREGNNPPLYCVEWLTQEMTKVGRMTLADRCWPAKPLSEEACKKDPVRPGGGSAPQELPSL